MCFSKFLNRNSTNAFFKAKPTVLFRTSRCRSRRKLYLTSPDPSSLACPFCSLFKGSKCYLPLLDQPEHLSYDYLMSYIQSKCFRLTFPMRSFTLQESEDDKDYTKFQRKVHTLFRVFLSRPEGKNLDLMNSIFELAGTDFGFIAKTLREDGEHSPILDRLYHQIKGMEQQLGLNTLLDPLVEAISAKLIEQACDRLREIDKELLALSILDLFSVSLLFSSEGTVTNHLAIGTLVISACYKIIKATKGCFTTDVDTLKCRLTDYFSSLGFFQQQSFNPAICLNVIAGSLALMLGISGNFDHRFKSVGNTLRDVSGMMKDVKSTAAFIVEDIFGIQDQAKQEMQLHLSELEVKGREFLSRDVASLNTKDIEEMELWEENVRRETAIICKNHSIQLPLEFTNTHAKVVDTITWLKASTFHNPDTIEPVNIWITGERGCGKTTFVSDYLAGALGKLIGEESTAVYDITEAGNYWLRLGNHWIARVDELGSSSTPEKSTNKVNAAMLLQLCGQTRVPLETAELQGKYQVPKFKLIVFTQNAPPGVLPLGLGANSKEPFYSRLNCFRMIDMSYNNKYSRFDQVHRKPDYSHCCFVPIDSQGQALGKPTLSTHGLIKFLAYNIKKRENTRKTQTAAADKIMDTVEQRIENHKGQNPTTFFDFDLDKVLPNVSTVPLKHYAACTDMFNYRTKAEKPDLTGQSRNANTYNVPASQRGRHFKKQSSAVVGQNIRSIHIYGNQGVGKTMYFSSNNFVRTLAVPPTYVTNLNQIYTKQGIFIIDDKVKVGDERLEDKYSAFYDKLPSGSVVITIDNKIPEISYNPLKAWKMYRRKDLSLMLFITILFSFFKTTCSYTTKRGGFARRYGLQGFDSFNGNGSFETTSETFHFLGSSLKDVYGEDVSFPSFLSRINKHIHLYREHHGTIEAVSSPPVLMGDPNIYDLVIVTNKDVNSVSATDWINRALRQEIHISSRLLVQSQMLEEFTGVTFGAGDLERAIFRLRSIIPDLRLYLSAPNYTLSITPEAVQYYRPNGDSILYDSEKKVFMLPENTQVPLGLVQAVLLRDNCCGLTPESIGLHTSILVNAGSKVVIIGDQNTGMSLTTFVSDLPAQPLPAEYITKLYQRPLVNTQWNSKLWVYLLSLSNSIYILIPIMAIALYALYKVISTVGSVFSSSPLGKSFLPQSLASPVDQDLDELYRRLEKLHASKAAYLEHLENDDNLDELYDLEDQFGQDFVRSGRKGKIRKAHTGPRNRAREDYFDESTMTTERYKDWFDKEFDDIAYQAENLREHKWRGGERMSSINHFIKLMQPGNKYSKQSLGFTPLAMRKRHQVKKGEEFMLQGPTIDSARLPGFYNTVLQNYGVIYFTESSTRAFAVALDDKYLITNGHNTTLGEKATFHFTSMVVPLKCEKIYSVPNQDLAIWTFTDKIGPDTQRPFKDLVKYLVSEKEVFRLTDMMVLRSVGNQCIPLHGDFSIIRGYDLPGETSLNARTQHFAFDWNAHDKPQSGDCGMPYMALIDGQYRFVGVHIGLQHARKVSVCAFLSKEMYVTFLKAYSPQMSPSLEQDQKIIELDFSDTIEKRPAFEGDVPAKLCTLKDLPIKAYLDKTLDELYEEPPSVGFHPNSKVCLSLAKMERRDTPQMYWHGSGKKATFHSDQFRQFPSNTSPVLDIYTLRTPQYFSYLAKLDDNNLGFPCQHETRMKAEFSAKGPSAIKEVDPGTIESMIRFYKTRIGTAKFISPKMALDGRRGMHEIGRMVVNTSTGFFDAHNIPRTLTKTEIFEVDDVSGEVSWKMNEDALTIRQQIHAYWEQARQGKVLLLPFFNNFKTECLPDEKVWKPRIFNSAPLAHLVFSKQIIADLVSRMVVDYEGGFTIKVDPRLSWNNVWKYFTKGSERVYSKALSMDFKCFDRTIPSSLFQALKKVLLGLLDSEQDGFTEEEVVNIVNSYVDTLRCRIMMSGNYLYLSTQGQASGIYATSFLDSFLNMIALADFAYVKLNMPFDSFMEKFSVLSHGDDLAINTTEEMANKFLPTELQDFLLNHYGLRAVSAEDKDSTELKWLAPRSVTFCSRGFFKIPATGMFTSKLKKSSVLSPLHWAKTHFSWPVLVAEWREILEEYWPYGREEFLRLKLIFESLVRAQGYEYSSLFPSFEEVRKDRMVGTGAETRAYERGFALQASRGKALSSLESVFENFDIIPGRPYIMQSGGSSSHMSEQPEVIDPETCKVYREIGRDYNGTFKLLETLYQSHLYNDTLNEMVQGKYKTVATALAKLQAYDITHFLLEAQTGKAMRKVSLNLFKEFILAVEEAFFWHGMCGTHASYESLDFSCKILKTAMLHMRDISFSNLYPYHEWDVNEDQDEQIDAVLTTFKDQAASFIATFRNVCWYWHDYQNNKDFKLGLGYSRLRTLYTSARALREISFSVMSLLRKEVINQKHDPFVLHSEGISATPSMDAVLAQETQDMAIEEPDETMPSFPIKGVPFEKQGSIRGAAIPTREKLPKLLVVMGRSYEHQSSEPVAPPINTVAPAATAAVESKTPAQVHTDIGASTGPTTMAPISNVAVDQALLQPDPMLAGAYDSEVMTAIPKHAVYPTSLSDADPSQLGYAKDIKAFAWRRVPVEEILITSNTSEGTVVHTRQFNPWSSDCVGERAATYAGFHRAFQGDINRYYKIYTNQIFFGSIIVAYIPAYITLDLNEVTVQDLRQFPWMELTCNDTKFASMTWQPTAPGPEYQMFVDRGKVEAGTTYGTEVFAIYSNVQNAFGSEIQIRVKVESQLSPTATFFNPDLLASSGLIYNQPDPSPPPNLSVDLTDIFTTLRLNIDGQEQDPLWSFVQVVLEAPFDWQQETDWSDFPLGFFPAPGTGETSTGTLAIFPVGTPNIYTQYSSQVWSSLDVPTDECPYWDGTRYRWPYGWKEYAEYFGLGGIEYLTEVSLPGATVGRDTFNDTELCGLKGWAGGTPTTEDFPGSSTDAIPCNPNDLSDPLAYSYLRSGSPMNVGLGGNCAFYDYFTSGYVYGFGGGFFSPTYLPYLGEAPQSSTGFVYPPIMYDGDSASTNWIARSTSDYFPEASSENTLGNISVSRTPLVGSSLAGDWKQVNFDHIDFRPVPVRAGEKGCAMMRCHNIPVIEYMEEIRGESLAVTFKIRDKLGIFRGEIMYTDMTFYMKYPHGNHAYLPGTFWGQYSDYVAYDTQRTEVITELIETPEMSTREFTTDPPVTRRTKDKPSLEGLMKNLRLEKAKFDGKTFADRTKSKDIRALFSGKKSFQTGKKYQKQSGQIDTPHIFPVIERGLPYEGQMLAALAMAGASVVGGAVSGASQMGSAAITGNKNIQAAKITGAAQVASSLGSANIRKQASLESTRLMTASQERKQVQANLANQGAAAVSIL